MIREFCAENHSDVERALSLGANRIELCDNLAVGGTTPSYGVIDHVCRKAHAQGAAVMTMIRPRGGDFCYHQAELDIMLADSQLAKSLGSDGLVFGALTKEGWLDEVALAQLMQQAEGCQTVFHMAFDQIPRQRQLAALDCLVDYGVTRILTRGGLAGSALEHLDWLKELVTYADGRIELVVGGGLTQTNYHQLVDVLGIEQVHGTRLFW
ncbi:copper homeostasis protein CutC [Streptococcus cuniculipharyngis]|uniref:PF03932 family protein CutC n=1 Tax=Streptococcus cuniculipharyngis TaxID=1562651 RepID=A0A5C5SCQ5_9STRE|nr:copper homeostasis protein CutC [Streptococcus cuniculipharyngis]TWS97160.1 copper homeostasis protein CutC [Streptococcus cuniculipharyngis]